MDDARYSRYLKQLALCAVAIFAGVPAYIQLFPMNYFDRDYPIWSYQIDFASTPSVNDPDILILGDSRVQAAIVPKLIGERVRSLAFGSALPSDVWLLFERYLENHRPPRAILISFAPFHFMDPITHKLFWVRTVPYKLWPMRDDLALIERARELGVPMVGPTAPRGAMAELLLHRLNYPPYYVPALRNARLWGRRSKNEGARAEIAASRGHAYYGVRDSSSGLNRDVHRVSFEPSRLYEAYLRDILGRAVEVGSKVLIATMPMNTSSFEALSPGFIADYEVWMSSLAADFPQVSVDPLVRALPNDYFGDKHHLNRRGARLVTEEFALRLRDVTAPGTVATELAQRVGESASGR